MLKVAVTLDLSSIGSVALIWRETRNASISDQLHARAEQRAGGRTSVVPSR